MGLTQIPRPTTSVRGMPLERLLSHVAYSLLVASKHGSNSERGDSDRRYRMSVDRNSAHSTQPPNPAGRAKPRIYTAPPAMQPLPPSSLKCSQFAIPCPQRPPQSPHTLPNPIPQSAPSSPPPLPTASASASLPPVSCQQSGSWPIARASIISALPSVASGNKLRGAADRAAWPASQCGVAGLSQRNPKTAQRQPIKPLHCRR